MDGQKNGKKNWFRKGNKKAINYDLWEKLLNLISIQEVVKFEWIKGHNGHTENERCDELANMALNGHHLIEDEGYLNNVYISSDNLNIESKEKETKTPKKKILFEGDTCRKCDTPVIKKQTKNKEAKPNQSYCYEFYLICPTCSTIYMVDEAKRFL